MRIKPYLQDIAVLVFFLAIGFGIGFFVGHRKEIRAIFHNPPTQQPCEQGDYETGR